MPVTQSRNKPVGSHVVDYQLSCAHLGEEEIEAAIFVPKIGEVRFCNQCKTNQKIVMVNKPYWKDKEED